MRYFCEQIHFHSDIAMKLKMKEEFLQAGMKRDIVMPYFFKEIDNTVKWF